MIQIFLCGGTIDKTYDPAKEIFECKKTHIEEMIKQARIPDLDIKIDKLFLKDSLNMNDNDREDLLRACLDTQAKRIIVMHGTSKMIESAKYLIEKAGDKINDKTIVFFGALYPYEHRATEAMFNLGSAIVSSQLLAPGTYIVMNGRVFPYDEVKKNVEEAHFVGKDIGGN